MEPTVELVVIPPLVVLAPALIVRAAAAAISSTSAAVVPVEFRVTDATFEPSMSMFSLPAAPAVETEDVPIVSAVVVAGADITAPPAASTRSVKFTVEVFAPML
jgi:hypothetical protein